MSKKDLIPDAAYDRLLVLAECVEEQKNQYKEHYWYLISEQVQVVVPDIGLLGVEVNGTYRADELSIDFYEKVDDSFKRCWRFSHIAGTQKDLVTAIVFNIEELLKDRKRKEKNIQRRKYRKGDPIRSVDELLKQEFVYFDDKIYHCGWVRSWQLNMVVRHMDNSRIFYAIRKGDNHG